MKQLFLLSTAMFLFTVLTFSQPGTLDKSFGDNGIIYYPVNGTAYGSALQANGKILYVKIKRWLHHHGFTWSDWSKAISNNLTGYAVQRSSNGVNWLTVSSEWLAVNSQLSSANSNYNDPSPLSGDNYYRLQTTSVDGAVTNSNVIAITANEDAIKISPNPAKNNLRIEGLPSNQQTKLTVVDFSGNIAISQQLPANGTSYSLNIASLKAGNYLLKIEMNGAIITKQFVKE